MNRVPAAVADCDDETGVSSPNSTLSSLISGKRTEREQIGEETEAERASCSRGSDDEDGGDASRKKLRLSKEQSSVLEENFKEHNTLNPVSSSLWVNLFFFLMPGWFLILALVSFGEVRGGFVVAEGKAGFGKTVESQAKASGGVVSEQKSKV
jgi:hypothetical protein